MTGDPSILREPAFDVGPPPGDHVPTLAPLRVTFDVLWPIGTDIQELLDSFPEHLADASIQDLEIEVPCRGCGCTDSRACDAGCSWAEQSLCTTCKETGRG